MRKRNAPALAWFEETQRSFKTYWEKVPWHTLGDATVATLAVPLKKYMVNLDELPDNFLPSVMDQYLAARWHRLSSPAPTEGEKSASFGTTEWRYEAFSVMENLGDYRFLCRSEDGKEFGLYSDGIDDSLRQGYTLFFSLIVEVKDGWYLTYGPILGWKGLIPGDLSYLASSIAVQLYAKSGFHAVVLASPVPFWASWSMGNAPAIFHGEQPVIYCWCEGVLGPDFEEKLPSTWKRADAGAKSCWTYKEMDFFKQRRVFLDSKTGRALIYALCPGDFNKALLKLGTSFTPRGKGIREVSLLMGMILKSILKKDLEFEPWLRPFEHGDTGLQQNFPY